MTLHQESSFQFLAARWPELHDLSREAEAIHQQQPDFAAIRLRSFGEEMVEELLAKLELTPESDKQFERLQQLQAAEVLDSRILSKLHALRIHGNRAAHNKRVEASRVERLLQDAHSLALWFRSFMDTESRWLPSPEAIRPGHAAQHLRAREEAALAMEALDPKARELRTPFSLREAFAEELSSDQEACVVALESFLSNPNERVFLLKGYAGTGKTFLARGLKEFLTAQGRNLYLCAPTGRAAKVLSEKTGHLARTIHSTIYDFSDLKEFSDSEDSEGSETYKLYADIARRSDSANTVFIVDEASLLSNVYSEGEFYRAGSGYLLKDLFSYVGFENSENDKKVIFIGDPAQLAPVGMKNSPALDPDYLREEFGLRSQEFELKEVLRQRAESGVLRNVAPLREALSKKNFGSLRLSYNEEIQRIDAAAVESAYLEAKRASGESWPTLIAWRNADVDEYNRRIRSRLFPGATQVIPGDRLLITRNIMVGAFYLANGEIVSVVRASEVVERRRIPLRWTNPETRIVEETEVVLSFRDLTLLVSDEFGNETPVEVKILDDELHGAEQPTSYSLRERALYVDFNIRHPELKKVRATALFRSTLKEDPYFNALRCKFGYAITCHKAQGGEWQHVLVDCSSPLSPRSEGYFRWLYTALTRSSERLYLIHPPEIRLRAAGQNWWTQQEPAAQQPGNQLGAREEVGETRLLLRTAAPSQETWARETGPETEVPTPAAPRDVPQWEAAPVKAAPAATPLEAFQIALQAQILEVLQGSEIRLLNVTPHQHQEAFVFQRGEESLRVGIYYNAQFRISSIRPNKDGELSRELLELLAPLRGSSPGRLPMEDSETAQLQLSRPFLQDFHQRLSALLDTQRIAVTALDEHQWHLHYRLAHEGEELRVNVYFDGKERLTRYMIQPPRNQGSPPAAFASLFESIMEELQL